ncbi:type IV toxin-antitoxin system AbiEi family antitoxin domain-containing protein [Nocardioides luteus]|uniref:type IV toxin-antitoxin system AbiEi family antitoxin domain-containing protein n=1 Tax=Nocardioides luteus TaxID=1844 RepID=UPI000696B6E4|nr:type IV toxin-antitoxin system AbiEi family antitoxin domain-containing protein [Nocardioides luteus]
MSDSEDLQAIFAREDAARMLDAQRRMQNGVATYAQLTAGGLSRIDIERAVRRNELRRVHPRVYIDHTGPLTWEQRAWAAVLYADPAVLCRESLEAPRGRDDGRPIHVAIDHSRKVMPQPGVVVHRMRGLALKAYGGTPPRLRVEDNALAMATRRGPRSTRSRGSRRWRAGRTSLRPASRRPWSARTPSVAASSSKVWWAIWHQAHTRCSSTAT